MHLPISPPGVYDDITAGHYHLDPADQPSLSSSIAKVILQETPRHAWFKHPRLNPGFKLAADPKFDLGSVAHELILGKGGGYRIIEFENYLGKQAKLERDEARAAGLTPILAEQFERSMRMCEAVLSAFPWLREGKKERVFIWEEENATCRAMVDWVAEAAVVDVKTTSNGLNDRSLARMIEGFGYDLSAAFYMRGIKALIPEATGRLNFKWLFIEDSEPYECRLIEPSGEMLELGERKAAAAIAKWQACMMSGQWPGYSRDATRIEAAPGSMERWLAREYAEAE